MLIRDTAMFDVSGRHWELTLNIVENLSHMDNAANDEFRSLVSEVREGALRVPYLVSQAELVAARALMAEHGIAPPRIGGESYAKLIGLLLMASVIWAIVACASTGFLSDRVTVLDLTLAIAGFVGGILLSLIGIRTTRQQRRLLNATTIPASAVHVTRNGLFWEWPNRSSLEPWSRFKGHIANAEIAVLLTQSGDGVVLPLRSVTDEVRSAVTSRLASAFESRRV